jgi:hypothetical protein
MRTIEDIVVDVEAGTPITQEEATAVVSAVTRRCRGGLDPESLAAKNAALQLSAHKAAQAIDTACRTPCGQDLNAVILAGPLDGEEHAYECPGCGNAGSYRAPRILIATS